MRRLALLFFAIFVVGAASAQPYKVVGNAIQIERVFENTGLTAESCSNRMFAFYKAYYKDDLDRVLREYHTSYIIWDCEFRGVAYANMSQWRYDVEYRVHLSFQDNRMRCRISAYKVEGASQTTSTTYYLTEAAPLAAKHSVMRTNTTKKVAEEVFNTTVSRMMALMGSIEKIVYKKIESDNW